VGVVSPVGSGRTDVDGGPVLAVGTVAAEGSSVVGVVPDGGSDVGVSVVVSAVVGSGAVLVLGAVVVRGGCVVSTLVPPPAGAVSTVSGRTFR
jgi:hypothetical protein